MNTSKPLLVSLLLTVETVCCVSTPAQTQQAQGRVIEVLADHDSRFKMEGQKQPVITVKRGELISLRITAKKARL